MKEADYMGGLVIDEMKIQVPFRTRKNYFLEITLLVISLKFVCPGFATITAKLENISLCSNIYLSLLDTMFCSISKL